MTVSEQPVSPPEEHPTSVEKRPAPAPEAQPATAEKKSALQELLIALGVLSVLLAGLLVYFFTAGGASAEAEKRQSPVSTAEWLAQGGDASGADNGEPQAVTEDPSAPAPEEAAAPPEPPQASVPDDPRGRRSGTVRSGVPVIKSLQEMGLSTQQAHQIISALEGVFDFRHSRPGDTFELSVDATGAPRHFVYQASLTEVYEVERHGDSLKGRRKKIPTTLSEKRFGGTISSSLYKTLSDVGAHPSLAGMVADVLSNEVDFFKEQRPGDTFRVIVEAETLDDAFLGYGPVLSLEYNGVKAGKKRFFRFEAPGRSAEYFSDKGISQPRSVISIPLHYTRISSRFGMRYHPVLRRRKVHNGVDFAAASGAPVWACADGEVTIAGYKGANGNLVGIEHDDNLQSYYAHLLRFASGIKPGVRVKRRQVIGYVGNTGRSTGPHLHFGLKKGGKFIDPLKYKVQPGRPIEARYRKQLRTLIREMGGRLDRTRIAPPSEPLATVPDSDDEVLGLEDW